MRYALIACTLFLSACGITEPSRKSEAKLSRLTIGGTKADTRAAIGDPDRVRAAKALEDGRSFELHEYDIYTRYRALYNALLCPLTLTASCWVPLASRYATPYWLQYVDGKLTKWGRAGDWQPDRAIDVNISQK